MITLIIITVISVLISIYCLTIRIKNNIERLEKLEEIENQIKICETEYEKQTTKINIYKEELSRLEKTNNNLLENIKHNQKIANETIEEQKKLSDLALDNYYQVLDNLYKEKEEEFNFLNSNLEKSYEMRQSDILAEIASVQKDLDKIKATRAAAIQANLREKEIEDSISFYCLDISDADKNDIARLEALKPSLNKPRVLSMLIWSTWFQKPLKALSAQIIGTSAKTGIYKITNIKTKECYIGQAVDIATRWSEHAKCGLGIDTPAGNKLYKAIQEYGLWNFSFEVLEECSREDLNEKEKYYIGLYDSSNFGYNSTRGNK